MVVAGRFWCLGASSRLRSESPKFPGLQQESCFDTLRCSGMPYQSFIPISWQNILGLCLLGWSTLQTVAAPLDLEPSARTGEWLIKTWETADGLPENSATAIVQTREGYLWFGTFSGLVRFDGV